MISLVRMAAIFAAARDLNLAQSLRRKRGGSNLCVISDGMACEERTRRSESSDEAVLSPCVTLREESWFAAIRPRH